MARATSVERIDVYVRTPAVKTVTVGIGVSAPSDNCGVR
jgi:hypothetical protein